MLWSSLTDSSVHSDLRDIDIPNIFHNVCVVVAVGRIIFGVVAVVVGRIIFDVVVAVRIIFGVVVAAVVVAVVGSLWDHFLPVPFRFVLSFYSLHICH